MEDNVRQAAQKIISLSGFGQALHINDILPDLKDLVAEEKRELLQDLLKWIRDQGMLITNDNDEEEVMVRLDDIEGKIAKLSTPLSN